MVKIMNKKEILELRKTFRPEECNISRIATCYVTSEKEKILEKSQAFLSLPEEEAFKYFDILKQALSGTVGKNLYTLKTNSIHPADESPQKLETLRKYPDLNYTICQMDNDCMKEKMHETKIRRI